MKNKLKLIFALLITVVSLLAVLPLNASAACDHTFGGTKWCDAAHPHEYYYFCTKGCGTTKHLGTYRKKTNCTICYPTTTSCSHSTTFTDGHPHPVVCRSCSKVLRYTTVAGCYDCCSHSSGYTYTDTYHYSGGYHEKYFHCNGCGHDIYKGTVSKLSSCTTCNPPVESKVSLSAKGPKNTIYSSGIIEANYLPASVTVSASCENCSVTSMYYYLNGTKVSTTSSSMTYTATDYDDFQSLTFYVTTNTGVTESIAVNFTYARVVEANVKWDYEGAVIRSVKLNGSTIKSGLSTNIEFDWEGNGLTNSDYDIVARTVGAYDGKTYLLTGSTKVRVYKPATGETLAVFDTYNQFDELCDYVEWSSQTLSAFASYRTLQISYQAPTAVQGTCRWVTDTGTVLKTQSAVSATGRDYVKPNESITVTYDSSDYSSSEYILIRTEWECGSDTGSSTSKTSYSKLYNYQTSPVNCTFVYNKAATEGSIKVTVVDADTNAVVSGARITCGGTTKTSNPSTFSSLDLGTYEVSATATGYDVSEGSYTITAIKPDISVTLAIVRNSGTVKIRVYDSETGRAISGASISGSSSGTTNSSGTCTFSNVPFYSEQSYTIRASDYYTGYTSVTLNNSYKDATLDVYLDPLPTTGDIYVTVYNDYTNNAISGATVTLNGTSKTTSSSGTANFYDISYGTYTVKATKGGYYSSSKSATILRSNSSTNVSIYLTPIPTSGDITVYVRDSETNALLSGATVTDGSRTKTTDSSGSATFYSRPFKTYTFTASLDGYVSNTGSCTISTSNINDTITIYLEKQNTDITVDSSINGVIFQGSTIIVPATVSNVGDIDFTPDNPITVTIRASDENGSSFWVDSNEVICPKNDSNLTWFDVKIPNITKANFYFETTAPSGANESDITNNTDTLSCTVYPYITRNCEDAGMTFDVPVEFKNVVFSDKIYRPLSWSLYEWDNGFVYNTYSAKIQPYPAVKPDGYAAYREIIDNRWHTRSGYGLRSYLTVEIEGNSEYVAGDLKVDAFFPEHNYSSDSDKSVNLELVNGEYAFPENPTSLNDRRSHTVPLWFPDGEYRLKFQLYDLWCPAGMLQGVTYARTIIDGDMYDDLYTN